MCEPTTIMLALSLATTAVAAYGQYQTGKKQAKALGEQSQVQADEISKAAGRELSARARAARRERGAMRAAASESGINLGSNSFLAALQTSAINQYDDMGLIVQNERGQQRSRVAQVNSQAAGIQVPGYLQTALALGTSAYTGYQTGAEYQRRGSQRATGN